MNIHWDENGSLFVGRIFVGYVDREVPENWREEYPELPDNANTFSKRYREIVRKTYAEQEATPWSASMQIAREDAGDDLGRFATEQEAKQALESAVRKELGR